MRVLHGDGGGKPSGLWTRLQGRGGNVSMRRRAPLRYLCHVFTASSIQSTLEERGYRKNLERTFAKIPRRNAGDDLKRYADRRFMTGLAEILVLIFQGSWREIFIQTLVPLTTQTVSHRCECRYFFRVSLRTLSEFLRPCSQAARGSDVPSMSLLPCSFHTRWVTTISRLSKIA